MDALTLFAGQQEWHLSQIPQIPKIHSLTWCNSKLEDRLRCPSIDVDSFTMA